MKKRKISNLLLDYGIIIFFVLLIIFFSIKADNFLTAKTATTILRQVSINGIIAVGMSFVILTGGIDLSVGAIAAFTGVIFCILYNHGITGIPAVIIIILMGMAFGLFNAFCVNTLKVPAMIATLGAQTAIRGAVYLLTGGIPVSGMPKSILIFAQGSLGPIPYMAILLIVVFVIGIIVLNQTKFGRHVYAVGGNYEASRLSGINTVAIRYVAFMISGMCTAIASMVLVSRTNSGQPSAGSGYEMNAITSAVLGGLSMAGGEGNLALVSIGVLIMGVLDTGMTMMYLNDFTQQVVQGLILIAAVAFSSFSQKLKAKNVVAD